MLGAGGAVVLGLLAWLLAVVAPLACIPVGVAAVLLTVAALPAPQDGPPPAVATEAQPDDVPTATP